jgi:hypothetical protein
LGAERRQLRLPAAQQGIPEPEHLAILMQEMGMKTGSGYKVEQVGSWGEFAEKVSGPAYAGWAFRGQTDATWRLISTLGRYLSAYVEETYWQSQEERITRIFRRKAHLFLTHVPDKADIFQWLALMQHHGAPTRLLDFTWSPYVAAFFALERATTQAAVWAINPKRLVNITERLSEFLDNSLPGEMGLGEPFVMNSRLIAQSGTFVVTKQVGTPIDEIVQSVPEPEDTLAKFELPADLVRPAGMRALFMMNITHATLFPDLDGLARSLAYELEFHWRYDPRKALKDADGR